MGEFDTAFNISASRNPDIVGSSGLDFQTCNPVAADLVQAMKRDMDRRGLLLDEASGPLNKDGALSLLFRHRDVPGAVVRIGSMDNPPDSAIVLKAAARLVYKAPDDSFQYQVHVLPFAPDIGEVAVKDRINTLRVLKAEGYFRNVGDIAPTQFVYLRDAKGELLRYPADSADLQMRGAPIAFVRDLNSIQANSKNIKSFGSRPSHFLAKHHLRVKDLLPAPPECVAAAHQQDYLAQNLRSALGAKRVALDAPAAPGKKAKAPSWRHGGMAS